jgi:carbamoyltransferase
MRVLGIHDGQTSGAAIVENGRILAAINEERIVRLKMARGFPWKAIREVMHLTGTEPKDLAAVAVGQVNMELREEVTGWPGWFEARAKDRDLHSAFFKLASRWGGLAERVPPLRQAYYSLRSPAYRYRRKRIGDILKRDFGIGAPVEFIDHHRAHAASAYFTSNFDDALVVTMDGGGDRHSSHVYSVKNGKFQQLAAISSYDSLGNYYAYVTAICGFKAKRHEGKITGLAAHGEPVHKELLASMIACEDGRIVNHGRVLFNTALDRMRTQLPKNWTREELAASIQVHCEELVRSYVGYWQRRTDHRHVALAGGLFANVRINQEVHELAGVEETFVHPGMTDEGLSVGAALALQGDLDRDQGVPYEPRRLQDVYLGNAYGEREIGEAVRKSGLEAQHDPGGLEVKIAELLANGKVVARFDGRMEYGPRALGNRSILYQPGDPSVNDWLNKLLRRTEFMPFAPASLHDATGQLYRNAAGAEDSARFMTITFHCTPWMRAHCSGVVHLDGTARPQIVHPEDNPSFYHIIEEYRRRTGVPVIINTSFNIHEEPIVRTPDDAIRAFLDSALDYLAIGSFLIAGPLGSEAARRGGT